MIVRRTRVDSAFGWPLIAATVVDLLVVFEQCEAPDVILIDCDFLTLIREAGHYVRLPGDLT